jgi:uncharacterized protein Yka (UPF0111/DUF47 family)
LFSGEAEVQAKRRVLMSLQDEAQKVMEGARELALFYPILLRKDLKAMEESAIRIRSVEDEVETLRRGLARELADIGTMIMDREDVLRASYSIEQIASHLSGISFRLSQLRPEVLKRQEIGDSVNDLIGMSVEMVHRLNELVRTLTISSASALNLVNDVQKIERGIDDKYRTLLVKIMKEVKSINDLILLKDIVEHIELMADVCLAAADSVTVLALSL